ncbi:MAG: adenosylmethionine decarboxylase [Pirellulales bacterium]
MRDDQEGRTAGGTCLAALPDFAPVLGTHCLLDLFDCQAPSLDDPAELERLARAAAQAAGAQVLGVLHHQFEPQGVSLVCLLAESHLSLHTWPEQGRVAADIYTCGAHCQCEAACRFLIAALRPRSTSMTTVQRGRIPTALPTTPFMTPPTANSSANP